MALIPLEHARRLGSPAEAEAFYRALGEKVVSARGYHTTDLARIPRLVDAVEPKRDHTVSFQRGTIDRGALDAFVRTGGYEYFDLRTCEPQSLRVWPSMYSWIHTTSARAAEQVAREPGTSIESKTTVVIPKGDLETALRVFHAVADAGIDRGFVMKLSAAAKQRYTEFLLAVKPQVDVVIELAVDAARALTELFPTEPHDWQAGGVLVQFPTGVIEGYVRLHAAEKERPAWFKRVDKALSKL